MSYQDRTINGWKLAALLMKHLEGDDMVSANDLGNLRIFRGDRYIGFVDLATEEVVVKVEDPVDDDR